MIRAGYEDLEMCSAYHPSKLTDHFCLLGPASIGYVGAVPHRLGVFFSSTTTRISYCEISKVGMETKVRLAGYCQQPLAF